MLDAEPDHPAARQARARLPGPVSLHWSPRSPFVRKVRIVIAECGLAEAVPLVRTVADRWAPDTSFLERNPAGTIPTLELSDGSALYDSRVICEYLIALSGAERLLPADGMERFEVLRRQALADGFLDAILVWRQERIREAAQQSAQLQDAYRLKATTALDRMNADCAAWPGELDLGSIALGSALSYLDIRFDDLNWRDGRRSLAQWADRFEKRPSALATRLSH